MLVFDLQCVSDGSGKQLLNAVDRMICNALEDVAQVGLGVQPVEFARTNQTVDPCGTLATGI